VLLHADEKIERSGEKQFVIKAGEVSLRVMISDPARCHPIIEPNLLTAAGNPGSVDKGERQQRGERLAVSTTNPVFSARFVMSLKIVGAPGALHFPEPEIRR